MIGQFRETDQQWDIIEIVYMICLSYDKKYQRHSIVVKLYCRMFVRLFDSV